MAINILDGVIFKAAVLSLKDVEKNSLMGIMLMGTL